MSDVAAPSPLAGVLLAAGASTRLGRPKAFLERDGLTLLVRAVRAAASVCDAGVLVVSGAEHERCVELLAGEPARVVYNPAWREGIGASVRQGSRTLPPGPAGVLLWVVDQPLVTAADLRRLADAWRGAPARPAAAVYAGGRGVPAILPAAWRPRLAALHGDTGARSLLRDDVTVSEVAIPAAAADVDSPEDIARLGLVSR